MCSLQPLEILYKKRCIYIIGEGKKCYNLYMYACIYILVVEDKFTMM